MAQNTIQSHILKPLVNGGGSQDLSEETVFSILQNRRRRYALHFLKQENGPVQIGDLTERVAAWEYDTTISEISPQERKRVYVSMVQTHLPRMEDEGILTFDLDRKEVELTQAAEDMDIYLQIVPENEISWPEFHIGITVLNLAILSIGWFEISPLDRVPDIWWIASIIGIFAIAGVAHFLYDRNIRLGNEGGPPR